MSIMGNTTSGAVRIYQINYVVGIALGSTLHMVVNKLFPPPGLGVAEDFDEDLVVTDGVESRSDGSGPISKAPAAFDKEIVEGSKA